MRVLHLVQPGFAGCGPSTLRLIAQLAVSDASIEHAAMVLGTRQDDRLARACGLTTLAYQAVPRFTPWLVRGALRAASEFKADVIHAWSPVAIWLGVASHPPRPLVGMLLSTAMSPIERQLMLWAMDRSRTPLLVASESARNHLSQSTGLSRAELHITHPMLQAQNSTADRSDLRHQWAAAGRAFTESTFIIALLGDPVHALDAQHGFEIAARVALSGRDVRLLLASDVRDRAAIDRFAHRLGLTDAVIWDDRVSRPWLIGAGIDAGLVIPRSSAFASLNPLLLRWAVGSGIPLMCVGTDDPALRNSGITQMGPEAINAASHQLANWHDDRSCGLAVAHQEQLALARAYSPESFLQSLAQLYVETLNGLNFGGVFATAFQRP